MTVLTMIHRPIAVNFGSHPSPAQCEHCNSRHIGVCHALADQDLVFLAGVAQKVDITAGKMFIEEGDSARFFYNINAGSVCLFKSLADGRRQITGFVGVGQFLGLSVHGDYAFSAEAMEDVEICRFDRVEMKSVFADFPALERRILDFTTHELVIAQDQMLLLGRKTAPERVASFLVSRRSKAAGAICTAFADDADGLGGLPWPNAGNGVSCSEPNEARWFDRSFNSAAGDTDQTFTVEENCRRRGLI
jgi:CRP/FNR family transcriptional regulator